MSYFLALLVVLFSLLTAGCPSQAPVPPPPDLPGGELPNPDFVAGSTWVNDNSRSPIREIQIAPKGKIIVRIEGAAGSALAQDLPGLVDGTYSLTLTPPGLNQTLLTGYPLAISYPQAVWFTDNPNAPNSAQLALLLPMNFGGVNYVVLLGQYIRGIDTMEWDAMFPVRTPGANTLELRPGSALGLKGELVFRRKR